MSRVFWGVGAAMLAFTTILELVYEGFPNGGGAFLGMIACLHLASQRDAS